MSDNKPEYLGDAVYATTDGYGVELRLNAHTSEMVVYLEPQVLIALIRYADRVGVIKLPTPREDGHLFAKEGGGS